MAFWVGLSIRREPTAPSKMILIWGRGSPRRARQPGARCSSLQPSTRLSATDIAEVRDLAPLHVVPGPSSTARRSIRSFLASSVPIRCRPTAPAPRSPPTWPPPSPTLCRSLRTLRISLNLRGAVRRRNPFRVPPRRKRATRLGRLRAHGRQTEELSKSHQNVAPLEGRILRARPIPSRAEPSSRGTRFPMKPATEPDDIAPDLRRPGNAR